MGERVAMTLRKRSSPRWVVLRNSYQSDGAGSGKGGTMTPCTLLGPLGLSTTVQNTCWLLCNASGSGAALSLPVVE